MKIYRIAIIVLLFTLTGCEKIIDLDLETGEELFVVEGHIEQGLPPYVILTRSQPFFTPVDLNELGKIFVKGATVIVSDGSQSIQLDEISSTNLPPEITDVVAQQFNVDVANSSDPDGISITVYSTLQFLGEAGKTYTLQISAEGKSLSSVTTVPHAIPVDSLWVMPHPTNPELRTLYTRFSDPGGERTFIRYFTSVNGNPYYPPYFQSVLDDKSLFDIDGQTFDFPLEKGHRRGENMDFDTFTYFNAGDTVVVRWCAIDQAHFDFWSTAEFDRGSAGNPLGSPTVIKTNIVGGLGIWGGYGSSHHPIIIE